MVYTAKNKGQTGSLINLLIALIIGVGVVTVVLFSTFNDATTQNTVTNQTVNFVVNETYYNLLKPNIISASVIVTNSSGQLVPAANYVVDTSYSRIKFQSNAGYLLGNYQVTYNWVTLTGTNRSIVGILPVFVAVLLLVAVAGAIGLGGGKGRRR